MKIAVLLLLVHVASAVKRNAPGSESQSDSLAMKKLITALEEEVKEMGSSIQQLQDELMLEIDALKQSLSNLTQENLALKAEVQDLQAMSSLAPFWSKWSEYSSCSVSCGAGLRSRLRTCDTPATKCSGRAQEKTLCNLDICPGGDILLIAGGSDRSTEVLGISGQAVSCEVVVPDLPVDGYWGTFFKHTGDPVFCPGYDGRPCLQYQPTSNTWKRLKRAVVTREASTIMHFEDYVSVTGGSASSLLSTTAQWNPETEQFEPGPALPYSVRFHCIATINATHALMTGGGPSKKASMFNRSTGKWTAMQPMKESRAEHACGLVGGSKVVVAGGSSLSSVEIFDLDTYTWSEGPDLPAAFDDATSVQLESTFLIVGGYSDSALDTVYEYDVGNNTWRLWDQRLKVKREDRPAVYRLPAQYLNCT